MSEPKPDFIDPFDDAEWVPARDLLARQGYAPPPPAELDDAQLRGRLWELIYALAARRIYLSDTDHLTDRELYVWLAEDWLNQPTADIPPEAEWNCRVDVTGSGSERDTELWLRYHADEATRAQWAADHPEDSIPPHEEPAGRRDYFLPVPPETPPIHEARAASQEEEDDGSDPLGLKAVDDEIRQARWEAEMDELDAEDLAPRELNDPSADPESSLAAFLEENELQGWERPLEVLNEQGVVLPPPVELTEDTIGPKLWELLHELACRGFFVLNTNHLSDQELYTALWRDNLREPAILPGRTSRGAWFHDFVGSGSEEHMQLWLRFYADEQERAQHAKEWPDDPLPPHETPASNRDWRLPQGPF